MINIQKLCSSLLQTQRDLASSMGTLRLYRNMVMNELCVPGGWALCLLLRTSGFWPRVRARLFGLTATATATPNGALRAPPPFAASLLLIRPPKINKIYRIQAARVRGFPKNKCFSSSSNLGFPRQGLLSFHWTTEAMK